MSNDHHAGSADPQPTNGALSVVASEALGLPDGYVPLYARIAQYPDCQQLQLWLPEQARPEDWQRLQVRNVAGRLLLDEAVAGLLQARRRLTLDALPWPVGALRLEIGHASGGCLRLQLRKYAHDEAGAPSLALPQPAAMADPGEDLRLRETVLQQLVERFQRRLSYTEQGRAGTVHYHEGALRLTFPYEISGGDDELLAISVPRVEQWELATGVSLARRDEILDFVAETARRQQCPSWQAEIRAGEIAFVRHARRKSR
ncbi:MAG: hypothetical protein IV097_17640 [Burkholderiaceae bacterium]|nr:hypothetical protein [Burkholderiaceae bacterium]